MKKFKYKVNKICKNIYVVIVPNQYDRAMLFCRIQEFYENPSEKIRNKFFSIWDFYKDYSVKCGSFTYTKDWSGYNLPLNIAKKCYKINKVETPYDKIMLNILNKTNDSDGYLIGTDKDSGSIFNHELCHAFYYTNIDYKNEMDLLTKSISKNHYNTMKNNLLKKGYNKTVVMDEIQAYLSTEKNPFIIKNSNLHKKYKKIFDKFKKENQ